MLRTTCWMVVLAFACAFALAPVHHLSRRAGLALSMQGEPYAEERAAREYLQHIPVPGGTELERVGAAVRWVRTNMRLQKGPDHPNAAHLIAHGGICGQFSRVLVQILRAHGFHARQVLLNWSGRSTSHVITEVKLNDGWLALDALGFGGGAFPGQVDTPYVTLNGRPASVKDLYEHPSLLPVVNTFGAEYFRTGVSFKLEAGGSYARLRVTPDFLYGRDWPHVRRGAHDVDAWIYEGHAAPPVHSSTLWHAFPYFSRLTLWLGARPLVFHFEWLPLAIALAAILALRARRPRGGRSLRWRVFMLGGAWVVYWAAAIGAWAWRYKI